MGELNDGNRRFCFICLWLWSNSNMRIESSGVNLRPCLGVGIDPIASTGSLRRGRTEVAKNWNTRIAYSRFSSSIHSDTIKVGQRRLSGNNERRISFILSVVSMETSTQSVPEASTAI